MRQEYDPTRKTKLTISISVDVAAKLQETVGTLKGKAVRDGDKPERVSLSKVVEIAIREYIGE